MAVALHELVAPLLEVEQREQLARAVLDLRPVLVVQAGDEAQELGAGELLVDERAVGDESEPLLGADRIASARSTPAIDDRAGRRAEDPGDHAEGGRLSGAVGPEEAEQLTARHLEVDRVDRGEAAVASW